MDPAVYGPRLSPEKAGSTRRGGGPEDGWGGLRPSPRGTFALAPLLRCIVSRRGNRGARFENGEQ